MYGIDINLHHVASNVSYIGQGEVLRIDAFSLKPNVEILTQDSSKMFESIRVGAAAGMRGDKIQIAAVLAMPAAVLGSGALGGIRLFKLATVPRGGGGGVVWLAAQACGADAFKVTRDYTRRVPPAPPLGPASVPRTRSTGAPLQPQPGPPASWPGCRAVDWFPGFC